MDIYDIRENGIKLNLLLTTVATASVIYHKSNGIEININKDIIIITCLHLASKIEEEYINIKDIIMVCYKNKNKYSQTLSSEEYEKYIDATAFCECIILIKLKFCLTFTHPHIYFFSFLKILMDWIPNSQQFENKLLNDIQIQSLHIKVYKTALRFMQDIYKSNEMVSLLYPNEDKDNNIDPAMFALSLIYLTFKILNMEKIMKPNILINTNFNKLIYYKPWWQLFIDISEHQLLIISEKILDLYDF
ncbi:unnamed protein product [Gordionus sp. m RMFG-2023]